MVNSTEQETHVNSIINDQRIDKIDTIFKVGVRDQDNNCLDYKIILNPVFLKTVFNDSRQSNCGLVITNRITQNNSKLLSYADMLKKIITPTDKMTYVMNLDFQDMPDGLCVSLNNLVEEDILTLEENLSKEGLNYGDKNKILFKNLIYIHLEFILDKNKKVIKLTGWFENPEEKRISSIKKIYPKYQGGLFKNIKIGPSAKHHDYDLNVIRNIYCNYCGNTITTTTINNYGEKTPRICDQCTNISTDTSKDDVTREYRITGKPEQLDTLEVLLNRINKLCNEDLVRELSILIFGDDANLKIIRTDNQSLSEKAAGRGLLRKKSLDYGPDELHFIVLN